MEYKILYSRKFETLENAVNRDLKNGWRVQGGVMAGEWGRSNRVSQAMVKD